MNDLKSCYGYFIGSRESYCEPDTINNYHYRLKFLCDYLCDKYNTSSDQLDVNVLSTNDLFDFQTFLRNREMNINHPFKNAGGRLKKRSVKSYMIDVKTFFNFLYDNRYIDNNINKNFKIIKEEEVVVLPMTSEEIMNIDYLFNKDKYLDFRNYLMIHLMVDCGLRCGEVIRLKRRDINLNLDYVFVERGKGNKQRVVPLPAYLKIDIEKFITLYHDDSTPELLLGRYGHGPITKDTVKSLFARIRNRTGYKRLHPHLLRHTFATSYICGGGDIAILKEYLGHYDISVTQKYIHSAHMINITNYPIYQIDDIFYKNLRR